MQTADELRGAVERGVDQLVFSPDLGTLEPPMRYALAGGGKRLRPVFCLATAEALGVDAEHALPAALAIELVHTFSIVHDDLPALDDDDVRRGRPTVHVEFGEATAVLVGDALLTEAFRLALAYETPDVARELARMTLGMIGGQELDLAGGADLATLHALKTGRLFEASVGCGLCVAEVAEEDQEPWRRVRAGARPPLPGRRRHPRRRRLRHRAWDRRSTDARRRGLDAHARAARRARREHVRARRPRDQRRRARCVAPTAPETTRAQRAQDSCAAASWSPGACEVLRDSRPSGCRSLGPCWGLVVTRLQGIIARRPGGAGMFRGGARVKKRLDVLLVERGLAESRAQAQALVLAGLVPGYDKAGDAGGRGRRS